jgi:hypothetical protein
MTIDNAKFRKPVVPGDRLEYHVTKIKQRGNIWRFHCEAMVDGAKVAEADIGAMLAPVRKRDRMTPLRLTALHPARIHPSAVVEDGAVLGTMLRLVRSAISDPRSSWAPMSR